MRPPHPAATRTRVTLLIALDPTGIALLLAGPTAFELWPGVRRVGEVAGRVIVETVLAKDRPAAASVRALPPRRTPTSYVSTFEWVGQDLPLTVGELLLGYLPGADGSVATHAALTLDSTGVETSALDGRMLEAMARGFLLNLARAAELRSHAA